MDYELLLFVLTVVTGILWVLDRKLWQPKRMARAERETAAFVEANKSAMDRGERVVVEESEKIFVARAKQPWWLEWTAGIFPAILLVFFLRSFVAEPFTIPSGSMLPTLYIGDYVLVNKFTYGIRLPVLRTKIIPVGEPKAGDVVVFKYPEDPKVDYIKRVVGVPGDHIVYRNKVLTINGVVQAQSDTQPWFDIFSGQMLTESHEDLQGVKHLIAKNELQGDYIPPSMQRFTAFADHITYHVDGFEVTVPEGQYFVMGDNRDNSLDSRFWGFVPEANLVGKAFLIWFNWQNKTSLPKLDRIGSFQ